MNSQANPKHFFRESDVSLDQLKVVPPESMGICTDRWNRVLRKAQEICLSGKLPALSIQVQRKGKTTGVHHFGTASLSHPVPVTDQHLFLVASLTKPILAMATMSLVEKGELILNDRVSRFFPQMTDPAKKPITIRHLLSHTSGLPDMLPNNQELRQANAPLDEFVEQSCRTELLFPPGRSAQYQSMGYALLGAILEKITGTSCREFLKKEILLPLGMSQTQLGIEYGSGDEDWIAEIDLAEPQRSGTGWNWNSRYWRELGAPWGGILSTAADLSRFLQMMLQKPSDGVGRGPVSHASIITAVENRLHDFPAIPDADRRSRGWGLGWRLNWNDHRTTYSDLLPAEAVGHWGATGTLFWIDRSRQIGAVLLTTRPLDENPSPLTAFSNMILASFVE